MALQCNTISHWLGSSTEGSLKSSACGDPVPNLIKCKWLLIFINSFGWFTDPHLNHHYYMQMRCNMNISICAIHFRCLTHKRLEKHGCIITNQHCGYWWLGVESPGHQYPQCWIFTALDQFHTKILHSQETKLETEILFLKKLFSCLRVNSNWISRDFPRQWHPKSLITKLRKSIAIGYEDLLYMKRNPL